MYYYKEIKDNIYKITELELEILLQTKRPLNIMKKKDLTLYTFDNNVSILEIKYNLDHLSCLNY